MTYAVKEIFYSIQGEGARAGRPSVFLRFAGCNLWSGREQDRERAICQFCDTEFVGTNGLGGGNFDSAEELAQTAMAHWQSPSASAANSADNIIAAMSRMKGRQTAETTGSKSQGAWQAPYVVCTGGEPLLQLDEPLIKALHRLGFEVAVETNGTLPVPAGIDWICVSPKAGAPWRQKSGDELKLVYPQPDLMPDSLDETIDFRYLWVQPMDGAQLRQNTQAALDYCLQNPRFALSIQLHKVLQVR